MGGTQSVSDRHVGATAWNSHLKLGSVTLAAEFPEGSGRARFGLNPRSALAFPWAHPAVLVLLQGSQRASSP